MFSRKYDKKNRDNNSRLTIVMAIIFLLAFLIIFRLFQIQVLDYDLYAAMASDQHSVFRRLEPQRGRVFIADTKSGEEELFPFATNKEFAQVFAVPKKIADSVKTAEELYGIFDQVKVEKEVASLMEVERQALASSSAVLAKEDEEFLRIKEELEVRSRKKEITGKYEEKLSKRNDPYEPLQSKVDDDVLKKLTDLKIAGIDYIMEDYRYYPEKNMGAHLLGFVNGGGAEKRGNYGLEGFFNEELSGTLGSLRAERSAVGAAVIVDDREYNEAVNGSDLVLTINRSIQFTACRKLAEAVQRHNADGGSVIILDPETGAIIAMCSYPDYDPNNFNDVTDAYVYNNPSIFNQWEPGSIFKAMTMAAALDQGKVTPQTTYVDKGFVMIDGWPKPIKNSDFATKGGHGTVNMLSVLENSLNTGVIFAMQSIGPEMFSEYVKNFGFGEKTGVELETESAGNISMLMKKKIRPIEAATATFGQGLTVTPLQMVNAYAVIANGGMLMQPYLVKSITKPNGERITTQPREVRRVISSRTAALLGGMLVNVVDNGHGKRAGVDGYFIAGKTGTAQVPKAGGGYEEFAHVGSFAGFAPVDDPVFVMLAKIDNPRNVDWAESSAAPLFGEIAKFILDYYQIPKER